MHTSSPRRLRLTLAAAAVAIVAGCGPTTAAEPQATANAASSAPATTSSAPAPSTQSPPEPVPSQPAPQEPASGTAAEALAALPVKGRAPKTGYDRDQFGQAWADVDRNGCDTRNDILARDLVSEAFKPGTRDCVVLTGTLADPYSGKTIAFQRGQDTSSAVQIDHVVALSNAWQTGAQQLDLGTRTAFANDPLNLLAVDGPLNGQKSDADAATWLPPNKAVRCAYVARQVAVKAKYRLWVTPPEREAIAGVLAGCPGEPLPTDASPIVAAPAAAPAEPPPAAAPAPAPAAEGGTSYANCDAVRAAGADPIRAGDPGYSRALDRDGDGVGCE